MPNIWINKYSGANSTGGLEEGKLNQYRADFLK